MQKYVLLKLINNSEASRVAFLQTHQPIFYQIRKSDMTFMTNSLQKILHDFLSIKFEFSSMDKNSFHIFGL